MKKFRLLLSLVACFSVILLSLPSQTSAQAGTKLQLSPTKQTVDINPGQTKTISVSFKNLESKDKTIYLFYQNFTDSGDESGTPKLTDEAISYGASNFMFGVKSFMLPATFTSTQNVQIDVPSNTPAGTYYGAIRASDSESSVSASIASLLFVNVGKITQTADIASFTLKNGQYEVRLKNTGNGFITPNVTVSLLDSYGKELEAIDVNTDKSGVISNTTRKYTTKSNVVLEPDKSYTAKVSVSPDNNSTFIKDEYTIEPAVATAAEETPTENQNNEATDTTKEESANQDKNKNLPYLIAGGILGVIVLGALGYLLVKKFKRRRVTKKGAVGTINLPSDHIIHHQTVVHTQDTYHPEDQTSPSPETPTIEEPGTAEETHSEPEQTSEIKPEEDQGPTASVADEPKPEPEDDKQAPGAPPAPS